MAGLKSKFSVAVTILDVMFKNWRDSYKMFVSFSCICVDYFWNVANFSVSIRLSLLCYVMNHVTSVCCRWDLLIWFNFSLVGLAFLGSIGMTFVILACALPDYGYVLAVMLLMLTIFFNKDNPILAGVKWCYVPKDKQRTDMRFKDDYICTLQTVYKLHLI